MQFSVARLLLSAQCHSLKMSYWGDFFINGCILVGVVIISVIVYFYSKDDCPVGTMPCKSGDICIPQKNVCNRQADCPEGEDEDEILCADLYGSTHLIDGILNSSLQEAFSVAPISNLCDIDEYPEVCLCGYRTRIYCNNAEFTEIPQSISSSVSYLGLQNNSITLLLEGSLRRYNLTLLYLKNNKLIYLAPNVFRNQHFLRKLFLMNNNLTSLEAGVFNGLSNLEWLHLDNNNLEHLDLNDMESLKEVKWLDLSYNNLHFEGNETFPDLPVLLDLYLNNNKIKQISNEIFSNLSQLRVLNLRSNQIEIIESNAFKNLIYLEELDLYSNSIKILMDNVFENQAMLTKLSVGKNPIKYLQKQLMINFKSLLSLNLEDIDIGNIDTDMFEVLVDLKSVYFKSYKYCSYAPAVPRCSPPSDGVSSTTQLLFKPIFRYSNWIMCFITITGNILVLFGRFLFRDENKNLSIVIKNLAVSDGLMGIYLAIIAYHDLKYRDNYNATARKWMSSWNCVLTGIIGMTSLEVSVMVLVFMSVDRYFVITMPYRKQGTLSFRETWRVLICIWSLGISISIIPALSYMSSTKFYGVNGLCLPLFINDPYFIGWQYSASIFFGINAPSLIIIIYAYGGMFINIKKTRNATSVPVAECEFALKFFFIVLANISCWLPIIIAKVIVHFEVDVSTDVYGWLVVFVLPINSSLNPILYTFTTRKYRKRLINVPSCIKKVTSQSISGTCQTSGAISSISHKN